MVLGTAACGGKGAPDTGAHATVYTTLSRDTAEPLLKRGRGQISVRIDGVYAVDKSERVDIVAKLLAEGGTAQGSVFWGDDPTQALLLKAKGLTLPYESNVARDISELYKDPARHWIGFSGRARVFIVNSNLVPPGREPKSIFELTGTAWRGRVAMANPLSGPAGLYVAALFETLGETAGREWLDDMKRNGVIIMDSDAAVAAQVAAGGVAVGLTDSYSAREASRTKKTKVSVILPDQSALPGASMPTPLGTLIIPNTVSLIAPNMALLGRKKVDTAAGRKAMEYLVSSDAMETLAKSTGQIPLRVGAATPADMTPIEKIIEMKVRVSDAAARLTAIAPVLKEWLGK